MESLLVITGLHTILTGICVDADRASAMAVECCSTFLSASRPVEVLASGDKPNFEVC
jgi:hypothetical protein